jgi:hypothetical protein
MYDYGIDINADYVIIRGVEIRDAGIHGIIIRQGRHDIVIENSHIRFWGRIGGPWGSGNFDGDMDSGIFAEIGTKNITIQRNLIEDPRGAANDWATGHPAGPQGISFIESAGGHVIRYNEITSTETHGFNDGILTVIVMCMEILSVMCGMMLLKVKAAILIFVSGAIILKNIIQRSLLHLQRRDLYIYSEM